MIKLTKTITVNGQQMVMSSMDGQSWFLRVESMVEFQKRLHEGPKDEAPKDDELEMGEAELQAEEDLVLALG